MKRTPHLLAIQSHVVFGHAGNSAAVFPMQRVGVNVWPLNTVQFSNHTQYAQGWQGMAMPEEPRPSASAQDGGVEAEQPTETLPGEEPETPDTPPEPPKRGGQLRSVK